MWGGKEEVLVWREAIAGSWTGGGGSRGEDGLL